MGRTLERTFNRLLPKKSKIFWLSREL